MEQKRQSWKKPVGILVALLVVVGIIGAVVVNKAQLNAPMDVERVNPEAAMGDVVEQLVPGKTVEEAPKQTDETIHDEPEDGEYVVDDEEPAPKNDDEEVETVLADDTMKDGEFEDEIAELGADDSEANAKKVSADWRRWVNCRRRCRWVRRCYRVKAGDRNNDDRDDFRRVCRRRRVCRCPPRGRYVCGRKCRRHCFYKRVRVCRWRRYRRCRRIRRRVRHSSDDYAYRYFTKCRWHRRRVCRPQRRRVCRNRCFRRCGCKCLKTGGRRSSS